MAISIYNQLVWLVDTIRSAGRISKKDLDAQWRKSSFNKNQEREYPLRSFHRHRELVTELFGLYICCDNGGEHKYEYYISEHSDFRDHSLRMQMFNALAFSNVLLEHPKMQERVVFEKHNTGIEHMSVTLSAMAQKRALYLTFKKTLGRLPMLVNPYSLKEVHHQWLLAAKPMDGQEVQVFNLGEVESAVLSSTRTTMPKWFNSNTFFEGWLETHAPQAEAPKKKAKPAEKPKKEALQKPIEVKKPAPAAKKKEPDQAQLSLF